MEKIRVFCYGNSPRVFKSIIAGKYCGTEVEYVGAQKTTGLKDWLWDYNAHPLSDNDKAKFLQFKRAAKGVGFSDALYKTDDFMQLHPFGTVPAAFANGGTIGITESNSIMRAVARAGSFQHKLYGSNPHEASRIDGFLDQSLVFSVSTQKYFLSSLSSPNSLDYKAYALAKKALNSYLTALEHSISSYQPRKFILGEQLSLVDICFACEICMFAAEKRLATSLDKAGEPPIVASIKDHAACEALFQDLLNMPYFASELQSHYDIVCDVISKESAK